MISQMADLTTSRAFRTAAPKAFAESGITHGRRRPPDDLRRLRSQSHLRARGPRVRRAGRGRRIYCLGEHRPRRESSRSTPTVVGCPTPTPACTACSRCRNPSARSAAWRPPRWTASASAWCTGWAASLLRPAPSCSATKRPDRHRRGLEGPGGRRAFSVAAAPSLLNRANLSFRKEGAAKCAAGHGQTGRLVGPRSEARPVAARCRPTGGPARHAGPDGNGAYRPSRGSRSTR